MSHGHLSVSPFKECRSNAACPYSQHLLRYFKEFPTTTSQNCPRCGTRSSRTLADAQLSGSPAIVGKKPLDRWLCAPAFQQVCLFSTKKRFELACIQNKKQIQIHKFLASKTSNSKAWPNNSIYYRCGLISYVTNCSRYSSLTCTRSANQLPAST